MSTNAPTGAGLPKTEPRHVDLHDAVSNDLSHAVGRLKTLKDEIAGSVEAPSAKEEPSTTPVAADIYANTPGQIRDLSVRISNLTDEIRKMVL